MASWSFLAAEDDVVVEHLRGEAAAVELRAGRARAAVVPGVAGAGDRAVDEVDDVVTGMSTTRAPS
jgi:hypothetical protein